MVFGSFINRCLVFNKLVMGDNIFRDEQAHLIWQEFQVEETKECDLCEQPSTEVSTATNDLCNTCQRIETCDCGVPKQECKTCMSWRDWFINKLENLML